MDPKVVQKQVDCRATPRRLDKFQEFKKLFYVDAEVTSVDCFYFSSKIESPNNCHSFEIVAHYLLNRQHDASVRQTSFSLSLGLNTASSAK
jgi:hypothetical protein